MVNEEISFFSSFEQIAAIKLESTPEERKTPIGTSDLILIFIESIRIFKKSSIKFSFNSLFVPDVLTDQYVLSTELIGELNTINFAGSTTLREL